MHLYRVLKKITTATILCLFIGFYFSPLLAKEKNVSFELLHMWRTPGEQAALKVFKDEAIKRGVIWSDYAVHGNFGGIRESFSDRYALNAPPTAMQWIIGKELIDMVHKGTIRKLPNVWRGHPLDKIIIPEVLEIVKLDNGISVIPLGIHIQNHIVYNKTLLKQLNAKPPKSWGDFLILAKKARKAGVIPLAMSDQRWQMRLLFSSMLVEVMSHQEWRKLFSPNADIESFRPKFEKAFGYLLTLKLFTDPGVKNRHWEDASKLVVQNKALAQVLGDYVRSTYPIDSKNFTCDLAPGNDYILWGADSLAFVNVPDEAERKAQDILFDIILDPVLQKSYVHYKGGIPVVQNVQPSGLGVCTKLAMDQWKNSKERIWFGGDNWQRELEAVGGVVSKVWNTNNITPTKAADMLLRALKAIVK